MGSPKSGSVVSSFEKPPDCENSHFFFHQKRWDTPSLKAPHLQLPESRHTLCPELCAYLECIPLLPNRIVFMALLRILYGNSLRIEKRKGAKLGEGENPTSKTTFIVR